MAILLERVDLKVTGYKSYFWYQICCSIWVQYYITCAVIFIFVSVFSQPSAVKRIKDETKTSITFPGKTEESDTICIEGNTSDDVKAAKAKILELVDKVVSD